MIKDIKYIIRKIVIGVGIFICLMFIKNCNVKADVTIGGTTLNPSSWSYVVGNRNVTIIYRDNVVYPTIADIPKYFAITFCSDTSKIESWYTSPLSTGATKATDVSIYKTNVPCNYPNSDYKGGRILYITGTNGYSASVSGTNAIIYNNITYYQPNDTSVVLLNAIMSNDLISVDYSTDTLISQNNEIIEKQQSIINQNQQIIQQNNNTYNMIQDENNQTQEKLDNIDDTMKDDNVDSAESTINNAKNSIANNGVITQLVTLPVTLFQNILNSVNGACSSYNMGSLYGTDIILPCINVSNYIGFQLWSVIDVLISGLFVWSISRKMIKVFNNFSTLKEGDVLGD